MASQKHMLPVRVTGGLILPKVLIDDMELPGLADVEIRLPVGGATQVTLHAFAEPLDIDLKEAVVIVELRDPVGGTARRYRLTAEEAMRTTDPEARFLNERRKAQEAISG